jgi:hypothetical protein
MCPLMYFQSTKPRVPFITVIITTNKRLLPSMISNMRLKITKCYKSLFTTFKFTHKRSLTGLQISKYLHVL